MPATECLLPVAGTPSLLATEESTSDCDAPVSIANVNGPLPSIVTGTSAITCRPCFTTLIATFSDPSAPTVRVADFDEPPQPDATSTAPASASKDPFIL